MYPQESVIQAFRNSYPTDIFADFQFPMIEDLINSFPFTAYREWRVEQQMEELDELGPALVSANKSLHHDAAQANRKLNIF